METVQIDVFTFDELSESAKEKAREWWRTDCDPLAWSDESRGSIEAFCDHFGIRLKDWEVGPFQPFNYSTDAENRHFRGIRLSQIDRDAMPTGYCLDATLWMTFYDHFKKTGDAKGAFDAALWEAFKAWRDDMEWQLSDECVDELLDGQWLPIRGIGQILEGLNDESIFARIAHSTQWGPGRILDPIGRGPGILPLVAGSRIVFHCDRVRIAHPDPVHGEI